MYRFNLITVYSPLFQTAQTKSQAILLWHLHLYDNFLSSLVEKNSLIFVSLTITQLLPNFRLDSYHYPTQTTELSTYMVICFSEKSIEIGWTLCVRLLVARIVAIPFLMSSSLRVSSPAIRSKVSDIIWKSSHSKDFWWVT